MALNLKQILTLGLGLGAATAFGYHFLTRPAQLQPDASAISELKPIQSFDLEPVRLPQPLDQRSHIEPASAVADDAPESFSAAVSSGPAGSNDRLSNTGLALESPATEEEPPIFELDAVLAESDSSQRMGVETEPQLAAPGTAAPELSLDQAEPPIDLSHGDTPAAPAEMLPQPTDESNTSSSIDTQPMPLQDFPGGGPIINDLPNQTSPAPGPRGWKTNPFIDDADAASSMKPSAADRLPISSDGVLPTQTVALEQEQLLAESNSVLTLVEPEMTVPAAAPQVVAAEPDRDVSMVVEQAVNPLQIPLQEADAQQAVHHIEYGKTLARRSASFSAREEFLKAIQLIAVANDETTGTNRHTAALRMATLIMKEAEDFSTIDAEQQIQMNVADVIETHRSHLLSPGDAVSLTPADAIDRYFAAAQQQLDLAGGRSPVSAEAFYCLGKLYSVMSTGQQIVGPVETARSVVFHQAALMSDPNHHRSANELGVLFAKHGRLAQAKVLFERSLAVSPNLKTWQNLAQAHQRLGESEFAREAENEYRMLAQRGGDLNNLIQWKAVDQFIAETPPEYEAQVASHNEEMAPRFATPAESAEAVEKKTLGQRLKEIF